MKRQRRERKDDTQWKRFQRRLERQRAEANRARDGRMGAASAARRLDPATGAVVGAVARKRIKRREPQAATTSEAEAGDLRALAVLERAGRDGAPAAWLADTATMGEAKAISLLRRGLVVATRSNRFVLVKWRNEAVSPPVTWDDGRRTGMVEPLPPAGGHP